MALTRRKLMGTAALGVGVLPCLGSPGFASADTTSCRYDGPGLYLYPGWGSPRPYLIRPVAGSADTVEFRDPASWALLWTQSLLICGEFAGKLSSM